MIPQKKIASTTSILAIIYVSLISLWFMLWLVVGDGNWWLTLLNRIVPFLFIPVPILLAVAILTRQIKLIPALLVPALIFVWLYRPYLLPDLAGEVSTGSELTVMTYNVLYSNQDDDAVARIILTYRPDFVALQEVQPAMMAALAEKLAQDYPYSRMGSERTYGTTAVYSRYPLSEVHILDLQADRPAVMVKARVQEREITFAALHLLAYGLRWVPLPEIPQAVVERTRSQNQQAQILLERLRGSDGIVLVGCDCNSYETSSSYRILAREMRSAARQTGWGQKANHLAQTSPDTELQHIDHVWYRGGIEPVRTYVIENSGGSDHRPVLVRFGFSEEVR